ncbi:HU family DNA-binding protein [Bacteroidales bacterium OttesenSCG-928-A17]|nr:HU family DNA-binding protein [Bacteroidales bacterium OttesenSCG-928-A17]
MALHYVVQSRKNPKDMGAPVKYYLIAKSLPAIDRKTFVEDMVRNTSLTKNEAITALDYLFESLPRYIALGHSVKLGELGSFRATIQSIGSDNEEDATPDKVTKQRVIFKFGKETRQLINNISLEKFPGK